jgi:hypothetical protein
MVEMFRSITSRLIDPRLAMNQFAPVLCEFSHALAMPDAVHEILLKSPHLHCEAPTRVSPNRPSEMDFKSQIGRWASRPRTSSNPSCIVSWFSRGLALKVPNKANIRVRRLFGCNREQAYACRHWNMCVGVAEHCFIELDCRQDWRWIMAERSEG